ncbi:MAG: hypothetical protein ACON35_02245 [Candidatus Marinamargulisbacteria bacterium]
MNINPTNYNYGKLPSKPHLIRQDQGLKNELNTPMRSISRGNIVEQRLLAPYIDPTCPCPNPISGPRPYPTGPLLNGPRPCPNPISGPRPYPTGPFPIGRDPYPTHPCPNPITCPRPYPQPFGPVIEPIQPKPQSPSTGYGLSSLWNWITGNNAGNEPQNSHELLNDPVAIKAKNSERAQLDQHLAKDLLIKKQSQLSAELHL